MMRDAIVAAGRKVTELDLSRGSSGNISVRDGNFILMTPTGSDLGFLDPASISVLDQDGRLVEGPKPSKEVPFHLAFYRRDPDTNAVVHVHSPAALAISCRAPWREWSAVPPITPYFVMRVGQTPLVPYADPGDPAQAEWIEQIGYPIQAVLLQNHGAVAAGQDLDSAIDAALELEQTCEVLLRLATASSHLLDHETAMRLAMKYGKPWTGGLPIGTEAAQSESVRNN
jgi:ribulose-5-phosphate 4-epimerase/fuculose-1-phosphate aldolase